MSQRSDQVAEELRKIISRIFLEDLSHLPLGFVTVTRVELTNDLRYARIFYSVLGPEQQKERTRALVEERLPQIRQWVVERIDMRFAMEIRLILDESVEEGMKIDAILDKIKKEKKPGA